MIVHSPSFLYGIVWHSLPDVHSRPHRQVDNSNSISYLPVNIKVPFIMTVSTVVSKAQSPKLHLLAIGVYIKLIANVGVFTYVLMYLKSGLLLAFDVVGARWNWSGGKFLGFHETPFLAS